MVESILEYFVNASNCIYTIYMNSMTFSYVLPEIVLHSFSLVVVVFSSFIFFLFDSFQITKHVEYSNLNRNVEKNSGIIDIKTNRNEKQQPVSSIITVSKSWSFSSFVLCIFVIEIFNNLYLMDTSSVLFYFRQWESLARQAGHSFPEYVFAIQSFNNLFRSNLYQMSSAWLHIILQNVHIVCIPDSRVISFYCSFLFLFFKWAP